MPYAISYRAKRTLITLFVVAVLLNYLWELAQAPLYVGLERYNAAVFWHCFERPGGAGYLIMLTSGLVLAVVVESVAVYILARWEYTDKMPTLPGLRIGLVPIAQMILLPVLAFRAVAFIEARKL